MEAESIGSFQNITWELPSLQEDKRMWSVWIVIWEGLLGQCSTEVVPTAMRKGEGAGLGMCTMNYQYVTRGSRTFIPITLSSNSSILCRVNRSASRCDWILITSREHSYYFNRDLEDRLILYHTGLVIIDMSKELEGEYQVLSSANRTCEARVFLRAVGPWFLYRILLLLPGITFLSGLGLLWDWLFKARNRLSSTRAEQSSSENIQHVIPPV